MSQVTRRELFPGVWLRAVHTNKFNSSYLSITLLTPLDRETAGANALIPEVLRRGGADTAVHGVVLPLQGAGGADILQPRREKEAAHNAPLGLASVGVVVVPALEPRLRQKADIDTLVGQLAHIQALIRQNLEAEGPVLHQIAPQSAGPALGVGDGADIGQLLHTADTPQNILFFIIVNQWLCLLMVYIQALLYRLRLIVVAQHDRAAAAVADTFYLRGDGNDMVGCTAV